MEFEDLSERVEWEARRVAAVFGVSEWQEVKYPEAAAYLPAGHVHFEGRVREHLVAWSVDRGPARLVGVSVGHLDFDDEVSTFSEEGGKEGTAHWCVYSHPDYDAALLRGLYRLGFEDEVALGNLNASLSAHEKMELRLSLAREFWPQQWIDEEGDNAAK